MSGYTVNAESEPTVDLVIVGAGPSGLVLAAWASRHNLNYRHIDDKLQRIENGRADALHPRTMEIMQSFGLAGSILKDACPIREIASWNPRRSEGEGIERTGRCCIHDERLGRYPQVGLQQGMIEQTLLDFLEHDRGHRVEWNTTPISCEVTESKGNDHNEYPITLKLGKANNEECGNQKNGTVSPSKQYEIVRAKYVVGADGAHSWVRQNFHIQMEGERTDANFGVMDIVPITNFPDARISCTIHSSTGSIMTVPREGRLMRFYVQLPESETSPEGVRHPSMELPDILKAAKDIIRPYNLDFKICNWSSNYTVGQRIAKTFSIQNRIFLVGDAVHTHSPTMGVGMNVSMQDSYNLGWKLGMVLQGTAKPDILSTYSSERRPVATKLIELDKKMSNFYREGPSEDAYQYEKFREEFSAFLSGSTITYDTNDLVAPTKKPKQKSSHQHSTYNEHSFEQKIYSESCLAKRVSTGQRISPQELENQADGLTWNLHDLMPADGRWSLLIFCGLATSEDTIIRLSTLSDKVISSKILNNRNQKTSIPQLRTILIHSSRREDIEYHDFPAAFRPYDDEKGYDYWTIFTSNLERKKRGSNDDDNSYQRLGIGTRGCLILCRPDQHVAMICDIEEVEMIEMFLERLSGR